MSEIIAVRVPKELWEKIKMQAKENYRSGTAEAVLILSKAVEKVEKSRESIDG